MRYTFFFLLFSTAFTSCRLDSPNTASNTTPVPQPTAKVASSQSPTPDATPEETAGKSATLLCQTVKTGDNVVYKKQTFAIDFEPFKSSCFVTTHNPEYDDPPMESEFAIYKNGKKVFQFPAQFNGVTFGCWVDAVAFQDLNEDKLSDVIVVGKCSGKSDTYNENMVYVNTGKAFTTREDANYQLNEKKTLKEIADFVKENRTMFFD
ncbi:MAG TPA: hypothetical protein VK612_08915 [Pyrinomonadaceae bacterium]|nr:hypothetical protein [Pyrinomonadaceae bacterium]